MRGGRPVARLLTATQTYAPGHGFHTRLSGRHDHLETLYCILEDVDDVAGVGEVRTNIAYLHGHAAEAVIAAAAAALARLPWEQGPDAALAAFDRDHPPDGLALPVRAALEPAMRDWQARRRGRSVAALFDGPAVPGPLATNQSVAWSDDDAAVLTTAERYVARGFTRLKVRLGLAGPEADRARLLRLRDRFGDAIELAADINGAWPAETVERGLAALAEARPAYVEQPCAADDWPTIARLAAGSAVPVMLDETLARPGDVDRLIDLGWRQGVHLKLVKLGGIDRVIVAGRRCREAGMTVMVGQMNEGAVATAAACAAAAVLAPPHSELYGADGLVDDPGAGVVYGDGRVTVTGASGLGVTLDQTRCRPVAMGSRQETTPCPTT